MCVPRFTFFSMLWALAARRHVGTLSDVQTHLMFVPTILYVSEVGMLLLSPLQVVRLGLVSFPLVLGVEISFLRLTVWVLVIVVHRFLGMCAVTQVAIARSGFTCVFRAVTVVEPLVVLNFTVPCIVDGVTCIQKRACLHRIKSSSDLCLTTDNSIILVTLSCPSWLSSVNDRFMVPIGHSLCPVKPTSGAHVGGLRLLF